MAEKQFTISETLLNEIIEYIQECEVLIDGELGSYRSLKKLIKNDDMPDIYNELINLKNKK